jgi:hypothetical protein
LPTDTPTDKPDELTSTDDGASEAVRVPFSSCHTSSTHRPFFKKTFPHRHPSRAACGPLRALIYGRHRLRTWQTDTGKRPREGSEDEETDPDPDDPFVKRLEALKQRNVEEASSVEV